MAINTVQHRLAQIPPMGMVSIALVLTLVLVSGCQPSAEERRVSIYELGEDPSADDIEQIRGFLADPDSDIRATALNKLVGLGVPDAEQLCLRAMRDEAAFVRSVAAKLLGDLGNPEHAGILVECLNADPDAWARQKAAESLGMLGGEEAAKGLALGLQDPLEKVRLEAAKGLRKTDPRPAVAELSRALLEDPSWEVRVQAAGALGLTGDPELRTVLQAALEDADERVRAAASNSLQLLEGQN